MNRRGFLKGALKATAFIPILPALVPLVEAAREAEIEELSPSQAPELMTGEGGYIVPSMYANDMEALIRRDYAEQIALQIDKAALSGSGKGRPILLKGHNKAKAIGKAEKITIKGSKLVAKVRGYENGR